MSDASAADDAYAAWKSWDAAAFGTYSRRAGRYFGWHVARACGERSPLRTLEIGFGNGSFLGWLRDHGHDVTALETNPTLVERARAKGFRTVSSLDQAATHAPFDLVAAFDVIEHIEPTALVDMLRTLRGCMSPGGRLLFRYPNGDSPLSLVHQNGDMTHVSAIGVHKLTQMASMSGWIVEHRSEAPWTHDLEHGRSPRAWLKSLARSAIERAVGFAYFAERPVWSPNIVAVLEPA